METTRLYLKLSKPRMWLAIAITVIPGMLAKHHWPDTGLLLATVGGTILVAISSFIFNQIWEIESDQLMQRTQDRPLPRRQIRIRHAVALAVLLLITGVIVLACFSHPLAALLALASFFIYIFIYTLYLKTRSPLNTIVGGLAGAVGPLIGEAAVSHSLSSVSWVLFGLLFFWQPPHFWALAVRYRDDYRQAGIKMLPVVYGIRRTWIESLLHQLLLALLILLAWWPLGIFSWHTWLIPCLSGALLVEWRIWQMYRKNEEHKTMDLFFMTILHMLVWNIAAALDLIWV